jgi:Ser/Thr protein kinase RdoA (MazF antagonist)
VRINGQLAVVRLGRRSDRRSEVDLAWEMELLRYLKREGMTVPVPITTTDSRDFVDGLVVMTHVEGRPPETKADWRRVADTFRQLHGLTHGWRQRPGHSRSGVKDFVQAWSFKGRSSRGRPRCRSGACLVAL